MMDINDILSNLPGGTETLQKPRKEHQQSNIYNPIKEQQEREKQSRKLNFKIAQNIKKSEVLRNEINKMCVQETDPVEILEKTIECISIMTGDTVFKNNIKTIKSRL